MGEGYDFVCSGEDDVMVADDGAASDGTDTDLFLRSAFSACTAVVDVFVFVIEFFVNGVRQCQCGAAGSVYLQIVVLLHDLYIEACVCQYPGSFF